MNASKQKPVVVGQKLWSLNVGNAARRGYPQVLTPFQVISVGRKYFTVEGIGDYKPQITFHLDSWRQKTNFSPDHVLYVTEQEWLDEKEASKLVQEIRDAFSRWNSQDFTTEQLRQIHAIITP